MSFPKPTIIPVADAWPAFSRWSFDYLKKKVGHKAAMISGTQIVHNGRSLTIAEYIDLATADSGTVKLPYLHAASIPTHYPELMDDLRPGMDCMRPNYMQSRLLTGYIGAYL
ncbi:MAG: hypothetical protein CL799_03540 [Chromatiales bacterium]|jgi:hypothetical protein|nr:hypothetical protein [Chromatiales bacterium]MDP7270407.1 hypothetical protein [Gammaproteobacteria bacterium]